MSFNLVSSFAGGGYAGGGRVDNTPPATEKEIVAFVEKCKASGLSDKQDNLSWEETLKVVDRMRQMLLESACQSTATGR